jgi:hypothetical protein
VRGAALLLGCAIALLLAGCGGSGQSSSPAARRLQREDLIAITDGLRSAAPSVQRELASARAAWRLVANGLPPGRTAIAQARAPIAAATASAAKLEIPEVLNEAQAHSVTGPGALIAGLFRSYVALARHGWTLIGAALEEIENGSPASARFARQNVALYIESVYDGHFSLAQIGKKLLAGYSKLGGQTAFGSALSEREVDALASAYSEGADRLHPHVGVRLGS